MTYFLREMEKLSLNIRRKATFFEAVVFLIGITAFLREGFSQPDPTLLKLREIASSSSLNIGKTAAQTPNSLLDNSIDPDRYFIGGGDVFSAHIVELPSVEYVVVVDQNCDAVISDLGIVRLGKKTLAQAKVILRDFIKSKLKKPYEVYASLVRAKSAIITVSGAITNPGTYQVEGTYRLFDALRMANNHVLPPVSEFDYREVKCTNRDTSAQYDLFRFLFLSDNSQNPYVYPGDYIHINWSSRRIFISGSVRTPYSGYLPIKSNETVGDFLSLFTLDGSADSSNILVTKYGDKNEARTIVFSLKAPEAIRLDDRDVILVSPKSNYPRLQIVEVSGEINRPGNYPIQAHKTDALSVIEQAGGPTPRGNMKRAFIIRHTKIDDLETAMNPQNNNPAAVPSLHRSTAPAVRPEIAAALSNVSASKDFAIIPLGENGKQVVLEANDEIVVPKIENVVYLSGNVKKPGACQYVEGKDIDYYIQQAGGLTSKGDKSNIFTVMQFGDVYQIKGSSSVEEGDVIIVPESQQYKILTTVALPIITVFLSALSTVILLYSVTKSQ
jgi:protein involved in polysaccharide export with SLBB domain